MKKLVISFVLVMILAIGVAGPVMADGPGNNGQGADPTGPHPPNDVYVPSAAYDNRGDGDGLPPNPDSQGAIFLRASSGG